MAQTVTLKDSSTSEQLYPITLLDNVLDSNGNSLANLVNTTISGLEDGWDTLSGTIEGEWENIQTDIAQYIGTPTIVKTETSGSFQLATNTFYSFGTVTSLTITLATPTSNIVNEYSFEFDSGSSTAATLSVPASVYWVGGSAPTIAKSKHYEVNIKYDQKTEKYYAISAEF